MIEHMEGYMSKSSESESTSIFLSMSHADSKKHILAMKRQECLETRDMSKESPTRQSKAFRFEWNMSCISRSLSIFIVILP